MLRKEMRQHGAAMVMVLVFIAALMLLGGALLGYSANEITIADYQARETALYYIAEAGIEAGIAALQQDFNRLEELTGTLAEGHFTVTFTDISPTRRRVPPRARNPAGALRKPWPPRSNTTLPAVRNRGRGSSGLCGSSRRRLGAASFVSGRTETVHRLRSQAVLKTRTTKTAFRGGYSPIGLDMGSSRVKLVQLKGEERRPSLHRCANFPAPGGCVAGGKVTDPALMAESIRHTLQSGLWYKNRANLCIGSQEVILRTLVLPPLSGHELLKAVRWEAEKQLPIPLEQAVFDFIEIGSRHVEHQPAREYLLVAAPGAVADSCTDAAIRAGLYPEAVEIAPLALARSLRHNRTLKPHRVPGNTLVLHIGAESTDLLILQQGRYRFYRYLRLGVNHFYREAAAQNGLGREEAHRRVFCDDPLPGRGLAGTAAELSNEIGRSLKYYAYDQDYRDREFQTMLLCGGGSYIPGLDSFLGDELGLLPLRFNPLASLSGGEGALSPGTLAEGSLYGIAHGLALRGWLR